MTHSFRQETNRSEKGHLNTKRNTGSFFEKEDISQFFSFIHKPFFSFLQAEFKKSRIRETKHLSTDADSSTDTIGGWTKAKSAKKKKINCAAISDHFQTKMFKC